MIITPEQCSKLGNTIRAYLENNQMSTMACSKKWGIAENVIRNYRAGKTMKVVQDQTAKKMERMLGAPFEQLIGGEPQASYTRSNLDKARSAAWSPAAGRKRAATMKNRVINLPVPEGEERPSLALEGEVMPRKYRRHDERLELAKDFTRAMILILNGR